MSTKSQTDELSPAEVIQIVGRTGIAGEVIQVRVKSWKEKTKEEYLQETPRDQYAYLIFLY